jgi:hypothetical protein
MTAVKTTTSCVAQTIAAARTIAVGRFVRDLLPQTSNQPSWASGTAFGLGTCPGAACFGSPPARAGSRLPAVGQFQAAAEAAKGGSGSAWIPGALIGVPAAYVFVRLWGSLALLARLLSERDHYPYSPQLWTSLWRRSVYPISRCRRKPYSAEQFRRSDGPGSSRS